MHYPDSRWRPRCQGKSRDDVSGRIPCLGFARSIPAIFLSNFGTFLVCGVAIMHYYPKL